MAAMTEEREREQESTSEQLEWAFLVSTASAGAAVFLDMMLFDHRYMDGVGAVAFAVAFAIVAVQTFAKRGRGRR